PGLLLAILMVALWGGSVINIVVAIAYGQIPGFIRLVRSVTLQLKNAEYIIAAKLLGLSTIKILFRHMLPNIMSIIVGNGTINIGFAILTASSLGFLGLGLDPSIPEWGAMIGSAKNYMTVAPHIILTVGFFIVLSILGFNLLGNALSDYMDPRRREVTKK
ncbi:MAG: ABC transporter permease, partial [Desulfurococcaceae archaeon]